ncbi:hypothetical protein [Actinosynnema sp. ALI-1.44]|nr:hypothetical protein [Actinosynnema sp. ALI-1.44]
MLSRDEEVFSVMQHSHGRVTPGVGIVDDPDMTMLVYAGVGRKGD